MLRSVIVVSLMFQNNRSQEKESWLLPPLYSPTVNVAAK